MCFGLRRFHGASGFRKFRVSEFDVVWGLWAYGFEFLEMGVEEPRI